MKQENTPGRCWLQRLVKCFGGVITLVFHSGCGVRNGQLHLPNGLRLEAPLPKCLLRFRVELRISEALQHSHVGDSAGVIIDVR
jgi:hypothetical protein